MMQIKTMDVQFSAKWLQANNLLVVQNTLINERDYSVGHSSAVGVPGQSILCSALFLISGLSVDEQNGEIYDIEIRENM